MKKYLSVILILSIGSLFTNAKANRDKTIVKAEMMTTAGDTIVGFIDFENYYQGSITYTIEKNSKEKYKINCGRLIQLSTSRWTFKRVYYDGKFYLLRALCEGKINLYYYPYTTPTKTVMRGNSVTSYGTASWGTERKTKYCLTKNEKTSILKLTNASKIIPQEMSDCEMISEELDIFKSENHLVNIVSFKL